MLVYQSVPNTLHVTWTPTSPLGHATGYRIYYDGDDGSSGTLDVIGGSSRNQTLRGLSSSVSYTLSIVTLSFHLPSAVVQYQEPIPISKQKMKICMQLSLLGLCEYIAQYATAYSYIYSVKTNHHYACHSSCIHRPSLEFLWSRSLWDIVWESHRRAARGTLSQSISLWSGQSQCSYHKCQHNWSGGVQYLPHHSDSKTRKTLLS